MKTKRSLYRILAISILSFFLCSLLLAGSGCSSESTTGGSSPTSTTAPDVYSQATLKRFRTSEVKEFQGKFLSPAVGPRDNSISGVQQVEITQYVLKIDGLVDQSVQMTYDEVKALTPYERLITLHCVEGWDATILWKGVLIEDLLKKAGIRSDAVTVIFHAHDGYTTSLPLATIKERQLILAYMSNGLPLPPQMGFPFIVVAEDKLGYKWARWVTRIELSSNANYQGYWEQFGYNNNAEVPASRK